MSSLDDEDLLLINTGGIGRPKRRMTSMFIA
jgi:hypothetical protein